MRVTPRALSFDLDDTLWACEEVIDRAERAVYAWLVARHPRITDEYDREAMRRLRWELAGERPHLAVDLTALRRASLEWHARRAGYADDAGQELAQQGVAVFLAERNRVSPYADVRPVLERLARAYPLIALTNGNADVHATGLGDLFSLSLSAGDVGAAKPDPAMFHAACDALSVRPGELIHVGDDPLRDVHAARRFGARAVWLNREAQPWPEDLSRAHHELSTLHDLVALLPSPSKTSQC
ncbi:MAG: HAD-IA family hydrolase [Halofilum sp. (in: g-proteobacteria)]